MDFALLIDLHRQGARQGPGSEDATRLAMQIADLGAMKDLRIADIGCGTGASTLVLASELEAKITAIDLFPEFLEELERKASVAALSSRIETLEASMEALPLPAQSLDVIWAEGAIYNMGFEAGLKSWRQFLKPRGIIAVSEITWLSTKRPQAITAHWEREYPQIATATQKIECLERCGYDVLGYFVLPRHCWLDQYYRPMQRRFADFLTRHQHSPDSTAIVAAEQEEIALYEQYAEFFSYGFYIARRSETG